jgi:hypothetical protein
MVRPKASTHNLEVGAAFAELLTIRTSSGGTDSDLLRCVYCVGQMSVYNALASFVPDICRYNSEKSPQNRRAMTEIELNKFLKTQAGWKCARRQARSDSVAFRKLVWFEFYVHTDVPPPPL